MEPPGHRAMAEEYLRRELGPRAPGRLRWVGTFDDRPLEGIGPASVYAFELNDGWVGPSELPGPSRQSVGAECQAAGPAGPARRPLDCYVVVAETEPSYFPAYGLDAGQAYSFYLGTRFMVEMRMQRVDPQREPPYARDRLARVVKQYVPHADVSGAELALLLSCEDQYFAVYRLELEGQSLYVMGADCPPGFYRLTEHPPQVALRLHLGQLIRAEARAARGEDSAAGSPERSARGASSSPQEG